MIDDGLPSDDVHNLPRRLLSRTLQGIGGGEELSTNEKVLYSVLCALFVMGSGLASGLTLGLMSLDKLDMQVLLRSGTPKQQRLARTIMPVIADPHWLLVTLLLCNAACFEALPLFLDVLINPVGAILISVTLILLFGEILPQAVCARHGLAIGAALGWPVRIMMWLTCPISWTLARFLDWLLGKEGYNVFMRTELKALVDLHGADEGLGGKLSPNEVQIICGALDLTNKIAFEAMTSLDKVVMLSTDQCLDRATISVILASGHSRLPVYAGNNKSNIIGLLLVKELLAYAFPGEEQTNKSSVEVSSLKIRSLPRLTANTRCYDMLKLFQTGRAHMVLLTQPDLEKEKQVAGVRPNSHASAGAIKVQLDAAAPIEGEPGAKAKEELATVSRSSEGPQVVVPDLALPGEPIGIITIEDVLEELMGQEILDETDHYADNEQTMPVNEELRARLAQRLPERLRELVLGSNGTSRRTSRIAEAGGAVTGRHIIISRGASASLGLAPLPAADGGLKTANHPTSPV